MRGSRFRVSRTAPCFIDPSSRRTPGPMRRGPCIERRRSTAFAPRRGQASMSSPRSRGRLVEIQLPNSSKHGFAISPRVSRELCLENSLPSPTERAQGMPGARCTRGSRATKSTGAGPQVQPETLRHSPRNGFNGFLRALPSDRAFLPLSSAVARQFDASVGASGPHDFAVRFSAVRYRPIGVHRIPRPTFVTIAKRPSY